MQTETDGRIFRFGGFVLDLERGNLLAGKETVFLRPKAYRVLTHLCQNIGRVVPKSELMDAVWPGVFVTEDSLTQSIRDIRKAIGEDLIRTVSKRGYMLSPGVSELTPSNASQPVIAVLRFRNESGDPADDALVDGFAEDIINGLARFGTLTVLARNSSFTFASFARSEAKEIKSRIGADYLVEGSVRRQKDRILAAVNLVDADNLGVLWGDRYQASDVGLFAIQRDIVEEIVGRLVTRVNNAGLQRSSRKPVTSLAAYELALRGVAMLRDPAQTDLKAAESLFAAAVEKDPNYGLGVTYLALARALTGEFGVVDLAVLTEARDLADRGAMLAPDQAACRRVQSLIRIYLRQHEAAERYLRMALEINPYDAECIGQMGFLLVVRGKPMDALDWLARAVRLDPLHPHWYEYDRSLALYLMGDYAGAVTALELSTRTTPWIKTRLAACYAQLGEIDRARQLIASLDTANSAFSPLHYAKGGVPFEHTSDAAHFAEGVFLALGLQPDA